MLIDDMLSHAADAYPNEACGLVVAAGKKHHRIIRAKNIAEFPRTTFDLDPEAWLEVGDHEEVVAIYHSHPDFVAEPSLADRSSCEASGLPWHIVSYPRGDHTYFEPSGFRAPYELRPYVCAVHDCYSIIQDWYHWELGIELPNYQRREYWWEKGDDLYEQNFRSAGFVQCIDEAPQRGDVMLMQMNSPVTNHGAVFLGDGTILHHVTGRLSTRDPWGGFWAKHATHHLRHISKMTY